MRVSPSLGACVRLPLHHRYLPLPPARQVVFVWNRTVDKIKESGIVPDALICVNLDDFAAFGADLIVEVAHPDITKSHGARFAAAADYFVGSPTAFADADVESQLRALATRPGGVHGVYVPGGALWGASDIQKMADRGTLKGLTITMKKHPSSMKVLGHVKDKLDTVRGRWRHAAAVQGVK